MTVQTKSQIQLAIKRQSGGLGSPESGSGATGYDVRPSQRMAWNPITIQNDVVRRDGESKRNRHGMGTSSASYVFPLRLGSLDSLMEAARRSTFTATFDVTQADITSITTTTSTIVGASGSFLTLGVLKGMMVKLTNHSTAGNNGRWIRVLDVSATTITVPTGDLTLDATPDTTVTLTFAKYLTKATTLVERYHTVEEVDLNLSTKGVLGTDMKVTKMAMTTSPTGLIGIGFDLMGLDWQPQTSAPILTSPTYVSGDDWVMSDGLIRLAGTDYSLEGFQFTLDMGGTVPQVMGPTGPDVILGNAKLSGSFQALIEDNTFRDALRDETVIDVFVTARHPTATDPRDFVSFYFGNVSVDSGSSDIAMTDAGAISANWSGGIDEQGGAHASTIMLISTSAA